MTNLEKYNNIFVEVFGADVAQLGDNYCKETVAEWDSVHQLNSIALSEEGFDLMLDPEDILGVFLVGDAYVDHFAKLGHGSARLLSRP